MPPFTPGDGWQETERLRAAGRAGGGAARGGHRHAQVGQLVRRILPSTASPKATLTTAPARRTAPRMPWPRQVADTCFNVFLVWPVLSQDNNSDEAVEEDSEQESHGQAEINEESRYMP